MLPIWSFFFTFFDLVLFSFLSYSIMQLLFVSLFALLRSAVFCFAEYFVYLRCQVICVQETIRADGSTRCLVSLHYILAGFILAGWQDCWINSYSLYFKVALVYRSSLRSRSRKRKGHTGFISLSCLDSIQQSRIYRYLDVLLLVTI